MYINIKYELATLKCKVCFPPKHESIPMPMTMHVYKWLMNS